MRSIICRCLEFDPANRISRPKRWGDLKGRLSQLNAPTELEEVAVGAACLLLVSLHSSAHSCKSRPYKRNLILQREKHIVILPFDVAGNDPDTVVWQASDGALTGSSLTLRYE